MSSNDAFFPIPFLLPVLRPDTGREEEGLGEEYPEDAVEGRYVGLLRSLVRSRSLIFASRS